jgi:AraC family transcriptional regulator
MTLIGPEARFISAMSPDANNFKVIPPLWHELTARRAEMPPAADKFSYGACRGLPKHERRREDELVYFAGISVKPDAKVPPGMARWEIPALTYACFTHRGPISELGQTIAAVYRDWLPQSGYARNWEGPELERYDERFKDGGKDCEIDYLVAVILPAGTK